MMTNKSHTRLSNYLDETKIKLQELIDSVSKNSFNSEQRDEINRLELEIMGRYMLSMSEELKSKKEKEKFMDIPKLNFPIVIGFERAANKINNYFENLFINTGLEEIKMSMKIILKEVFDMDEVQDPQINKYLKRRLGILQHEKRIKFSYPTFKNGKCFQKTEIGKPFIFPRSKFIEGNSVKMLFPFSVN